MIDELVDGDVHELGEVIDDLMDVLKDIFDPPEER
jgi:hypothetical protein